MAAVRDLGKCWRSGAVDVHYSDAGGGTAALVVCDELALAMVLDEHVANVPRVAPYEPGALFKRELPCIRAVLALNGPLDLLVVDGYATLDPGGRPGLGAYAERNQSPPEAPVKAPRFSLLCAARAQCADNAAG